jgi:hypothetical protein
VTTREVGRWDGRRRVWGYGIRGKENGAWYTYSVYNAHHAVFCAGIWRAAVEEDGVCVVDFDGPFWHLRAPRVSNFDLLLWKSRRIKATGEKRGYVHRPQSY